LDSYKAPTLNAPFLVSAVISQLELRKSGESRSKSLSYIIEEMTSRLRKNRIVSGLLSMDLDRYLNFDIDEPEQIFRKMSVLNRELSPSIYALKVFELLKIAILDGKKKEIDFLSRELVTILNNIGMSHAYINKKTVDFFFTGGRIINNIGILDQFYLVIFPHFHYFDICFKIRSAVSYIDEENIKLFDIEIREKLEGDILIASINHSFDHLHEGQKYILVKEIKAFDIYTAVGVAKDRISQLHDLFRVFHHKNSFELSSEALAEQCCVDGIQLVSKLPNRMQFVNDFRPKKASVKLDYLLNNLKISSSTDLQKFLRVVDFHGMSVSSEVIENQLLNIWISLETISPSNASSSKISNVCNSILPFIGINYYRRIVDRATFDLIRWNRREMSKILKKISAPKNSSKSEKILRLLILSENKNTLTELFSKLGDFELLKFRLFELSEFFSKTENVRNQLDLHQKRVSW
jgi:hypothetical protein